MRYRERLARVCEYHGVKDVCELIFKHCASDSYEEIRDFVNGRIPARSVGQPLFTTAYCAQSEVFW